MPRAQYRKMFRDDDEMQFKGEGQSLAPGLSGWVPGRELLWVWCSWGGGGVGTKLRRILWRGSGGIRSDLGRYLKRRLPSNDLDDLKSPPPSIPLQSRRWS